LRCSGLKLLTPGPVQLPREVLEAVARQPLFHRSVEFREVLGRVVEKLRMVYDYNSTPVIAPGTGTLAVDIAVYNYVDPGDRVLVVVNGVFGERLAESVESRGGVVYKLNLDHVEPDVVEDYARRISNVKVVAVVHNETSMGVANRFVEKLQGVAESLGAILIVDSVSGIPAEPIRSRVDVIATASHKAFLAPPGASILYVSVEPKVKTKVPPSMDLRRLVKGSTTLNPPYTPPINVVYGLDVSLDMILKLGVDGYHEVHRLRAQTLYSSLKLESVAREPYRSYTVTAFWAPNPDLIVRELRKHGYIIARGMGVYEDKMIRVGVLGDVSIDDLRRVVEVVNNVVD